jgi:hypothetical protein
MDDIPKGKFTGYTKTTDQAAARAAFEQEHGYTPAGVFDGGSIWLVGPILAPGGREGDEHGQLAFAGWR